MRGLTRQFTQFIKHPGESVCGKFSGTDIHTDSDLLIGCRTAYQCRQQRQRQIVDRLIPQVFQHFQSRAFSGSGHAGHYHDAAGSLICHLNNLDAARRSFAAADASNGLIGNNGNSSPR